ncbi:MAG: aminotransferase class I/II-fold pyridoxal phosphate-dependent enzyme [Planctomycetota bacterium]
MTSTGRPRTGSLKAARFSESVIREMSRVCALEGGVNLAQGFPDFEAPAAMKAAACRAIEADVNQYAVTWGAPRLRAAIAERARSVHGIDCDAEQHVTVTCGATEAMIAALLASVDPGDEVIVFEPFYENYGPDCVLVDATPRFVRLGGADWTFDEEELAAAFGPRTRAILVNTPHNPTGKVFSREELEAIAALCCRYDVLAITDEIYDAITYDDAEHISIATLDGMAERTITINGLSKTWSATGWRIGWAIAPAPLTSAIRKVHDFLTVGAAAPLQEAAAEALGFEAAYFDGLRADYAARRRTLLDGLRSVGLPVAAPAGAYYVMVDVSSRLAAGEDDIGFARRLVTGGGVATVPGSSFFQVGNDGARFVRFCFAKRLETIERAITLLHERLA